MENKKDGEIYLDFKKRIDNDAEEIIKNYNLKTILELYRIFDEKNEDEDIMPLSEKLNAYMELHM